MSDERIRYHARIELARREFFYYCRLKAPDFYREDRGYLVDLCREFQEFIDSNDDVLIVNLPPRHGKTRTASALTEWCFGRDPARAVMLGSYNEILSTAFSRRVRDTIQEVKASERAVYAEVFPRVAIKRGEAAANLWSLEGQHFSYLSTSPKGSSTGFGCQLMILDDLIKSAEEALNENALDKHWQWFTDTMLTRLEEGGKIIVIATRWAEGDLTGRIVASADDLGWRVRTHIRKAVQDDGSMLCPDILSRASYERKAKAMGADIASANFQQEPLDLKGRLYSSFRTYTTLPEAMVTERRSYTDTADEGTDYLCCIDYAVVGHEAYVLDVLYTQAPMEETEPAQARMMTADNVDVADIESNNGGRGYARSVQRLLRSAGNHHTSVRWFHQSKNKRARILSNATWVMEHIYFPANWCDRWPEFYKAMCKYVRDGKNVHDDAPDACTGIAETLGVARMEVLK
jgi:predicted phage terminase large subunit-like protein